MTEATYIAERLNRLQAQQVCEFMSEQNLTLFEDGIVTAHVAQTFLE